MSGPLEHVAVCRWNPARALEDPAKSIVVFGPSGCGKTVMMLDILNAARDKISIPVGFMGSVDSMSDFSKCIPKSHLQDDCDEAALERILATSNMAKVVVGNTNQKRADPAQHLAVPNFGVIMDDCFLTRNVSQTKAFRQIVTNDNHDDVFCIVSTQYVTTSISVAVRRGFKIVIVFPTRDAALIRRLRETLLDCFDTDQELSNVFDTMRPYEALVYERFSREAGEPYLFFHKAEFPTPTFRIWSNELWKTYYSTFARTQVPPVQLPSYLQLRSHRLHAYCRDPTGSRQPPSLLSSRVRVPSATTLRGGEQTRRSNTLCYETFLSHPIQFIV